MKYKKEVDIKLRYNVKNAKTEIVRYNVKNAKTEIERVEAHIEYNQYKIDTWGRWWDWYEERNRQLKLYINKLENANK